MRIKICIDKQTAVLNAVRSAYLKGNRLSGAHCVHGGGNVIFPCGKHENYIRQWRVDKPGEVHKADGAGKSALGELFLHCGDAVIVNVAYCGDLKVVALGKQGGH